ncbi:hypothetical protein B566_EDAN006426 [Ephemera danica]|nr:hypothetical protein B566_EDAN006426 [Ephemera danica]
MGLGSSKEQNFPRDTTALLDYVADKKDVETNLPDGLRGRNCECVYREHLFSGATLDLSANMTRSAPTTFDVSTVESDKKKLPYPKAVFFIVSNEFCERFCYYGMRTILSLYLVQYLLYTEDTATTVYHSFVSFAYLTPVLGAMIADSWLGKFKTILYLSMVYATGSVLLSLAAMPGVLPPEAFTIIGLLLIGFGTGGIKPCVSSFGGEQFVVPEQDRQLQQFFSVFYFAINFGSLISTFTTPILREDVQCFDADCYSLAFGVPAMLMVISIIIFASGYPLYKIKKPEGNVVLLHGLNKKIKSKGEKKEHWLDFAEEKYGKKLVSDVKSALNVLFLFIPLPLFWTLFDQQANQIQAFNPLLVMILIPLFEGGIYPFFAKFNILQKPLHKMTIGGSLAGPSLAVIPMAGEAQLGVYNTLDCPIIINIEGDFSYKGEIPALDIYYNQYVAATGLKKFSMTVQASAECSNPIPDQIFENLDYEEEKASSYGIAENGAAFTLIPKFEEHLEKSSNGDSVIKVVHNFNTEGITRVVRFVKKDGNLEKNYTLTVADGKTPNGQIPFGDYKVYVDNVLVNDNVYPQIGGVYSYVLTETDDNTYIDNLEAITSPNTVNIFWQIPQYIVITSGEIMFSITGLEFAFTQMWEFVLFAGLLFICMGVFFLMTLSYKYVTVATDDSVKARAEKDEKEKELSHENAGFDGHKD